MSIFGTIMSKVFGHAEAAPAGGATAPSAPAQTPATNPDVLRFDQHRDPGCRRNG